MASGEDRISALPDELLSAILVRVRSARDAVRTSVLSRRWRHILVRPLPELVFQEVVLHMPLPPPAPEPPPRRLKSFLDNVDAALAACDAPVIKGLRIVYSWYVPLSMAAASRLPTGRVERWLRFASERVVESLHLRVFPPGPEVDGEEPVLEYPLCEWVKRIHLAITWRIRPPSAGLFRALVDLTISDGRMDGSELTALVCTQCPCLRDVYLLLNLVDDFNISIRSDSLQSLQFCITETQRLEIVAPRLEKLFISKAAIAEAQITAPKLEELDWPEYDPIRHQFDNFGRRLRVLQPGQNGSLMQQFDEVDELKLSISIPQELAGYKNFLNETNRLPKCKILSILSWGDLHALVAGVLHLLSSCNSTRKIYLSVAYLQELEHRPCLPTCPCLLEESYIIDDISLNSLEEVEITSYRSSHKVLEFVEQLSRCNASSLEKVVIKYMFKSLPPTKEVREKIRSMYQPNIEVEFLDEDWVLLD